MKLATLDSGLSRMAAAGYGVSLLVHLLLVVVLSLLVVKGFDRQQPPLSTRFSETDNDDLGFDEIADVQLEMSSESESDQRPPMPALQPANLEPVLSILASEGGGDAGETVGFRMPSGGKAVTKGSFTAWTVPEDPKPRHDYLIVIQIELPAKVKRYQKEDLTGFLTGDDGYTTPIGSYRGSKYPKKYYGQFDMKAKQFVIKIPGAAAKVKDTIRIQSKLLKEKQLLEIVF